MSGNTSIHGVDRVGTINNGKVKWRPIAVNPDGSLPNTFIPSQYDTNLTMDGSAQSVVLATGVTKVYFANQGAVTEAIRVAFGTSAANAEANLNIAGGLATTGHYIPAAANAGSQSAQTLGVPTLATHYAVANAVAADTLVVSVTQGV